MQSGISALAAVLRAHERTPAGELFMAHVTKALALFDGGITIPKEDYVALASAGEISADMDVLAAWVDGRAVVIGAVSA